MNTANLLWGLVFGSIGLGYFLYGKRQSNVAARLAGIGLMIYPYFFESSQALVLVGLGLMLLPKFVDI
ncbi:hypothetical protein [Microbulbifer hainanensis]|uniref:hypothetical protein n=1 Tax=Microbulbifer hainanensis TaxID=2735675 RepID=UPI0018674CF6|nr:hypothetical protein [Microbulbifer hainanensis]